MATLNFIPGKLLIGAGLLLSMSSCALHQHKHKPFLSIQTTFIKERAFSPVVEAISPLESTTNVEVKPQIDGTVIFGGLVVATVLSLGVVPPVYVLVKNLE